VIALINLISAWAVPAMLLVIPLIGLSRKVPVYESFVQGAKEGFATAVRIIPYLVAMFVAIRVFQNTGMMQILIGLLSPWASRIGIPVEVIPLALIRPLSGSGALGTLAAILKAHGPDSLIGLIASTMQGSTETTFYVLTVYFGAVGIRNIRHCLSASLFSDLAGFLAATYVAYLVFGSM